MCGLACSCLGQDRHDQAEHYTCIVMKVGDHSQILISADAGSFSNTVFPQEPTRRLRTRCCVTLLNAHHRTSLASAVLRPNWQHRFATCKLKNNKQSITYYAEANTCTCSHTVCAKGGRAKTGGSDCRNKGQGHLQLAELRKYGKGSRSWILRIIKTSWCRTLWSLEAGSHACGRRLVAGRGHVDIYSQLK